MYAPSLTLCAVVECMQVLVITCMALLWLSGAVHGYERGTARSGVLEMCGNELEVIMVARMSTKLCLLVHLQVGLHGDYIQTNEHSSVLIRATMMTSSSFPHISSTPDRAVPRS